MKIARDILRQATPYIPNAIKYGFNYTRKIKELREFSNLHPGDKERFITETVLLKIREAYDHTKFYFDLYNEYDLNPHNFTTLKDIEELPIITKKDIMFSQDDFLLKTVNKCNVITANTGGSTGTPLKLYRSKKEIAQEYAYLDFYLNNFLDKKTLCNCKKVILRGDAHGGEVVKQFGCNLVISSQLLTEANVNYVIDEINRFNPDYIHAFPSSLLNLINYLKKTTKEISVNYVLTSSESILPFQIELIERVLGCKLLDLYGNSEHSALALRMNGNYVFDLTYGYTEFLSGKIISTKLLDSPMPLIRYDCDDTYTNESVVDNNRTDKQLSLIGGRKIEYITDRDLNQIPVVSLIFGQHYSFFDKVSDFCIIQKTAGEINIEYIAFDNSSFKSQEEMQTKIVGLTNGLLNVSFKRVDKVRVKSNGKKAFLIREIE